MKVYIAGAISGVTDYAVHFRRAKSWLAYFGHTVLNPAELPEGMSKADYMSICVPMLLAADVVFMLTGWEASRGARIEAALAKYCGKIIRFEQGGDFSLRSE